MFSQQRSCFACGALVLLLALSISACSLESVDSSDTATLRLTLVDSPTPIEGIEAINIVFSSILVHKNASAPEDTAAGWITVMDDQLILEDRSFNLLDLVNGEKAVLGEVDLEPGHYSQIRIIIESSSITVKGVTSDLKIPSGEQSGLKLTSGFDIEPDIITELTLDFDAGESVKENPPGSGKFKLQPTIRLVQTVLSGTISGTVTPLKINALVAAYETGTTTAVTSTYVDTTTGEYVLQALLGGTYDIVASAVGYIDSTKIGVVVTAEQDNAGQNFELTSSGGGN